MNGPELGAGLEGIRIAAAHVRSTLAAYIGHEVRGVTITDQGSVILDLPQPPPRGPFRVGSGFIDSSVNRTEHRTLDRPGCRIEVVPGVFFNFTAPAPMEQAPPFPDPQTRAELAARFGAARKK